MNTISSIITIKLNCWEKSIPFVVTFEVIENEGNVYISESDGLSLSEVGAAIKDEFPDGTQFKSNYKDAAWATSHESLRHLDGKIFKIKIERVFSDEGEFLDEKIRKITDDILEALSEQTDTKPDEWEELNGPTTGVGIEKYYQHKENKCVFYCVDDQGDITCSLDEEWADLENIQ